jgi:hypothetical protein
MQLRHTAGLPVCLESFDVFCTGNFRGYAVNTNGQLPVGFGRDEANVSFVADKVVRGHDFLLIGPFPDPFAQLRKVTNSFVMSVRMETTRIPLDGFS